MKPTVALLTLVISSASALAATTIETPPVDTTGTTPTYIAPSGGGQPSKPQGLDVPAYPATPPPAPPPEPEFDPESRNGAQQYETIFPPSDKDNAKPLPKVTATIGDFTREVVNVQIRGQWYRLPREMFAKMPDLKPGTKIRVRMSDQQLKQYRIVRK